VFATRDDSRFDALAAVAGESFDVEDRQRHTAQLYDQTDAWSRLVDSGAVSRL
jgi:hypothetical protein